MASLRRGQQRHRLLHKSRPHLPPTPIATLTAQPARDFFAVLAGWTGRAQEMAAANKLLDQLDVPRTSIVQVSVDNPGDDFAALVAGAGASDVSGVDGE